MDTATLENFDVAVSVSADSVHIQLSGELDMASAPVLLECLQTTWHINRNHSLLLLDFSELTYCDSAGIRALLQAAAQCNRNGTQFRVIRAGAAVRRVLELTDTLEALNLDSDEAGGSA